MSLYGYIRVSTRDQNEDRQLAALSGLNIPDGNVYQDKQSGKDFDRPAYLLHLHLHTGRSEFCPVYRELYPLA